MAIKVPRYMIRQLKKKISEQEKRVARAALYLEELREALKACEPIRADLNYQSKAGYMRAAVLSPERRAEIASKAAKKRWATNPLPDRKTK